MKVKSLTGTDKILFLAFFLILCLQQTSALTGSLGNAKMILYPEVGFLGTTLDESVIVKNVNNFSINVSVEASEGFDIATVLDKNFILEPNSEKEARFKLRITKVGNYSGTIDVFFRPLDGKAAGVVLSSNIIVHAKPSGYYDDNDDSSSDDDSGADIEDTSDNSDSDITGGTVSSPAKLSAGMIVLLSSSLLLLVIFVIVLIFLKKNTPSYPNHNKSSSKKIGNKTGNIQSKIQSKKYAFIILLISIFIVSLSFISSKDIAYVVETSQDSNIISDLNNLGYSYDVIPNVVIPLTNFSDYAMLLVQGNPINKAFLPLLDKNSLIIVDETSPNMASIIWPTAVVSQTQASYSLLEDLNTSFTQGFPSKDIQIYSPSQASYYLKIKPAILKKIANSIQANSNGNAFVAYSDQTTRSVFFGLPVTDYWTSDTERLFKNTVKWVRLGVDMDGDGFFSGFDCNDNNASINPNATEISYNHIDENCDGFDLADTDKDGYCKSDYIIQNKTLQCKNETGNTGTDCDDLDLTVNPDSNDSLKNCRNDAIILVNNIGNITWNEDTNLINAFNLNDYFSDPEGGKISFDVHSTGPDRNISLTISTDGNVSFRVNSNWNGFDWVIFKAIDNEGLYTLSNKVFLNVLSVPDAPVLGIIKDITVNETDKITIVANATDVDGDSLNYSINNTQFNKTQQGANGAVFEWTTDYDDAGIYFVDVEVTDGNLTDNQEVKLIVANTNRPPIMQDFQNITLDEDKNYTLKVGASDADNDSLIYSAISNNINELKCSFRGDLLNITPAADWNGDSQCNVSVSDGYLSDNKVIYINVKSVNDAPVLEKIGTITVNETDMVIITANANDVDGDSLNYSSDTSRFVHNKNIFAWQTKYGDAGDYFFNVSVSDGELTDTEEIKIIVLMKNRQPTIGPIADVNLIEDSGISSGIELSADDEDKNDSISRFEVSAQNMSEVKCSINNSKLYFEPYPDFSGVSSCSIRAYDNFGAYDETIANIIITGVNDAPIIDNASPDYNPKIGEDKNVEFGISWHDVDTPVSAVTARWSIDSVEYGSSNNLTFQANGAAGIYNISVVVTDGELYASKNWFLTVTDKPLTSYYDGETTNFTEIAKENLNCVDLVLEKTLFGKIKFLQCADMTDIIDLDAYTTIKNGLAGIDTAVLQSLLNKPAEITMYNLNFDKTPVIYYNQGFTPNASSGTAICSSDKCSDVVYNPAERKLTFKTNSFSTFIVGNTLTCSEKKGFVCGSGEICRGNLLEARDTNQCCSSKCELSFSLEDTCSILNDSIKIEIDDPEKNDEFNPGETISVSVDVKNNLQTNKNFDVRAVLYDLDDQNDIDKKEESLSVDAKDHESEEIKLKVPKDIEESHSYVIYADVKDSDNNALCNENYVPIKIERDENDVAIKSFNIEDDVFYCSDLVKADIRVENLGSDDQDVYLRIENSELNIDKRTDIFELEKFGDKDESKQSMSFKIPDNSSEGTYDLNIAAFYSGEHTEITKEIRIGKCKKEQVTSETIILNKAEENDNLISLKVEDKSPLGNFYDIYKKSKWSVILLSILIILTVLAIIMALVLFFRQ